MEYDQGDAIFIDPHYVDAERNVVDIHLLLDVHYYNTETYRIDCEYMNI